MHFNEIHWHDTLIRSITIDTEKAELRMRVDYPVNWEGNEYEQREIIFSDAHGYREIEGPFAGSQTILSANITPAGQFYLVRLETNAGYREVGCSNVQFAPS